MPLTAEGIQGMGFPLNSAGQFNGDWSALTPEQLATVQAALAQAQSMIPTAPPTNEQLLLQQSPLERLVYGLGDAAGGNYITSAADLPQGVINLAIQAGLSPQQVVDTYNTRLESYKTAGNDTLRNFLKDAAGAAALISGGLWASGALAGGGATAGGAGSATGAAAGANTIDPALADSVYGGMLAPGGAAAGTATGAAGGANALLPGSGVLAPTTGIPSTVGGAALAGAGLPADLGGPGTIADLTPGKLAPGGGVLAPPGGGDLLPITSPGTYVPGPGNGVPLPTDQTLQPFPSPPAGLGGATIPSIPTGGSGATAPADQPQWLKDLLGSGSSAPAWLNALLPALNALGQYESAGKASDAQAAAYQAAIDEQKRQFDLTRSDYAPYLATGTGALGRLNQLSSGDMTPFQVSPDYNFRKQQGLQGIENQFSASGGALSGNALKALNEFNSGLASGEYGNYWNRQAGLAGVGQTATGQVSQLGSQTAGNVGNALIGQGDARGTGLAGQWGAFGNLANSLYKNFYPTPRYSYGP